MRSDPAFAATHPRPRARGFVRAADILVFLFCLASAAWVGMRYGWKYAGPAFFLIPLAVVLVLLPIVALLDRAGWPGKSALARSLRRSRDMYGRVNAAKALGNLGPKARDQVPALLAALEDSEWWVRYEAALALVKVAPEKAEPVPTLVKALDDIATRGEAMKALRALGLEGRQALEKLAAEGNEAAREALPRL